MNISTNKVNYCFWPWRLPAVVALLCLWQPLRAEIGPIVIKSSSEEGGFQSGDVVASEYTGFGESLTRESLQQTGQNLAEIAAARSGIQFRQSGGLGSFSTVTLRASTAAQVNVYLDGILLNEAAGGGVNLSDIELLDARRVDIYRGVIPGQLGNSAIGGAINIQTRRAGTAPRKRVLFGGGSFATSRFSASYAGPLQSRFSQSLVTSFSHRASDNNFDFQNDNGTPLEASDDRREPRRNNANTTTSGLFKSSHRLGESATLVSALQGFQRTQGIANFRNSVGANASLDTRNLQWRGSFRGRRKIAGFTALLDLYASDKNERFDDRDSSVGLGAQITSTSTRSAGLRSYWEKVSARGMLAMNARMRFESLRSDDLLQSTSSTHAERNRADINFQYSRFLNAGRSLLSASLFGFSVNDDYRIENRDRDRDDFSGSALTPQLGFSHSFAEAFTVRGNLSRQKRVPSFFELFGSRGLFESNAGLRTETSVNADIGLELSNPRRRKDAFIRDWTASVALFHSRRDDLIARVYDARGIGRSENIAAASVTGLELNLASEWVNGLSLGANATWQDAVNRGGRSGFEGRQLPNESAFEGALNGSWNIDGWSFGYQFQFSSDRFYDGPNLLPAADQRVHSLNAVYRRGDWSWRFELNNLTDANYEDFNGFPKPGRAGFFSVTYQPE